MTRLSTSHDRQGLLFVDRIPVAALRNTEQKSRSRSLVVLEVVYGTLGGYATKSSSPVELVTLDTSE